MNKSPIIFLLLMIATIVACRTSRISKAPASNTTTSALLASLDSNTLHFDYLAAKMKIEYKDEHTNTSFKADLRMKKDSILWLSISPALGIEVVRVLITADSIKVLNRMNKQFMAKSIQFLADNYQLPMNFSLMQTVLTNGPVYFMNDSLQLESEHEQYIMKSRNDKLKSELHISGSRTLTQMMLTELSQNRNLNVTYDNYMEVSGHPFSMSRMLKGEANMPFTAKIEFTKVQKSEPLTFPYVVPEHYEKVD